MCECPELSWAAGHHDVVGLGVAAIWAGLCAAYRPCVGLACYKVWGKNFFNQIWKQKKREPPNIHLLTSVEILPLQCNVYVDLKKIQLWNTKSISK